MSTFLSDGRDHAVVILLNAVRTGGRFMAVHGPHGRLRALPIGTALRLCEAGEARLPGRVELDVLRRVYEKHREARELAQAEAA